MAKRCVKYKLHYKKIFRDGREYTVKVTPDFIADGGYFTINNEHIGATYCSSEGWIEDTTKDTPAGTLVELNKTELKAHMETYHSGLDLVPDMWDTQQKREDYIDQWWIDMGLP